MKKKTKLTIYMKSGNNIIADNVVDWKIKYNDEQINHLMIHQDKPKYRIVVGSIDLKQIECVVEH